MKLFTVPELKAWDEITIKKQFDHSRELMLSAAEACAHEIMESEASHEFAVFCGTGNNGGDGLCISRILSDNDFNVSVYIVGDPEKGSEDFRFYLEEAVNSELPLHFLAEKNSSFELDPGSTIVDCIFGIGLNKKIDGWRADLINTINKLPNRIISIDLPSGLMADEMSVQEGAIVEANRTLTIEVPKRAMMFREHYRFVGEFMVIHIGFDPEYHYQTPSRYVYYQLQEAVEVFQPREKFGYKYTYGHVQMIAGSKGKMGAAILASSSALRSGSGLVTSNIPGCGEIIFPAALPEAMCITDEGIEALQSASPSSEFTVAGIGPGIGTAPETAIMLRNFLKKSEKPLVLDADALNIIASKKLIKDIPGGSILTPHIGEFDRLFGKHESNFERIETQKKISAEHQLIIVLKGPHTTTSIPDGRLFFNSTGNPAMATAGSGDVLTGIITSLVAQGYPTSVAAPLGVFIHGLAGDIAANTIGKIGILARDIIGCIPEAISDIIEMKEVLS